MAADQPLSRAVVDSLRGGWNLFTLRTAPREDFAPRPEVFVVLIAAELVLVFLFALAAVGLNGSFNPTEIPRALLFVPLALGLGLIAVRIDPEGDVLRLPVAFAAAGLYFTILSAALYLLAQHQWLPFAETYWSFYDYFSMAWAGVVVVLASLRLVGGRLWARLALGAAGVVVLVLPVLWMPTGLLWVPRYDDSAGYATSSFHSLAAESSFYAQRDALERELSAVEAERPGVPDIYLVAAGLFAGEDVFMKEIRMIKRLFRERFDAEGRTVTLLNNPKTIEEFPIASITSLRETLAHVGTTMNVEEDVLVLYVSSHGSENHELVVDFRPIRFSPITPPSLKAALDQSGIRWKVIIVSACFSGGFVDALKDERTMVITASSADRKSFGCSPMSEATYLAQALFAEALRKTHSFEQGFAIARESIEKWEREQHFTASQPQLFVGAAIKAKLAEVERRLAAQEPRRTK